MIIRSILDEYIRLFDNSLHGMLASDNIYEVRKKKVEEERFSEDDKEDTDWASSLGNDQANMTSVTDVNSWDEGEEDIAPIDVLF